MKNTKNIATIVASVALAMGISSAKPTFAQSSVDEQHLPCEDFAADALIYYDYLIFEGESDPIFINYGMLGEVSTDEYDECFVREIERISGGKYLIITTKKDQRWDNGTSYLMMAKPKEML